MVFRAGVGGSCATQTSLSSGIVSARLASMNTERAAELAGGVRALASLLGLSPQAVYAWHGVVPKMRVYQLRALRPQWFVSKKKRAA